MPQIVAIRRAIDGQKVNNSYLDCFLVAVVRRFPSDHAEKREDQPANILQVSLVRLSGAVPHAGTEGGTDRTVVLSRSLQTLQLGTAAFAAD